MVLGLRCRSVINSAGRSRLKVPERLVTGAWLVVMTALFVVGITGISVGLYHPELLVHPEFSTLLARLGIPVWLVITVGLGLPILSAGALGVAVWIGRRDDRAALLFCLGLLGLLLFGSRATFVLASMVPGLRPLMLAVDVVSLVTAILLLFTFPTGTFRPSWSRSIAYPLIALVLAMPWLGETIGVIMSGASPSPRDALIVILFGASLALGATIAQITRFRRLSTTVERQQVKWVAFSLGLLACLAAGLLAVFGVPGSPPVWAAWLVLAAAVIGALVPVAVGVALFRYHLYDIDQLISRTVSYALVVGVLAVLFATIAVGIPQLLGLPDDSPLLIAGATLAVAALFSPLRGRVQRVVDRRFNRTRYDAQREVDDFVDRLREGVQVDDLSSELIGVVVRTMQPTSASMWIREQ